MKENRFYKAAEKGYSFRAFGYDINLAFLWFDLWFGFYYDRAKKTVYFCPLPTICFRIRRAAKIRVTIKVIGYEIAKAKIGKILAQFDKIKQDELEKIAENTKKQIMNIHNDYAERMNYHIFSGGRNIGKTQVLKDDLNERKAPVVAYSPEWFLRNGAREVPPDAADRLAQDDSTLTAEKFRAMVERVNSEKYKNLKFGRFRPPIDTRRGEIKPSIYVRGFRTPPKNRRKRREGKGKAK